MIEDLKPNEILCPAHRVKYSHIEYSENFVTITQNRTRRRVYKGYYFDDDGEYIYISTFYSCNFQHKATIKHFVLNKDTKEWRDWQTIVIEHHKPQQKAQKEGNIIDELKK